MSGYNLPTYAEATEQRGRLHEASIEKHPGGHDHSPESTLTAAKSNQKSHIPTINEHANPTTSPEHTSTRASTPSDPLPRRKGLRRSLFHRKPRTPAQDFITDGVDGEQYMYSEPALEAGTARRPGQHPHLHQAAEVGTSAAGLLLSAALISSIFII